MANLIGTAPDQVPINGMLGMAAFVDSDVGFSGAIDSIPVAPTIASATTIAPTNLIQFVSGTTAIATITPPTNLLTGGGILTLIPTGAWATNTAGNIALAITTTVGEAVVLVYDSITAKWYPVASEAIDTYKTSQTPTVANATATLTIAQLLTLIITTTSSTAVALTLPTGTLTDAGILNGLLAVNMSFDWSLINLGSSTGAMTLTAGTTHTIVGNTVVAISTSTQFRTRKTAANTFVTYRIS